jgi:ABC-type cobalt transport system substrate-binding protein
MSSGFWFTIWPLLVGLIIAVGSFVVGYRVGVQRERKHW